MAFAICLGIYAQISVKPIPIDNSFRVVTGKNKLGQFKSQKIKGKVSGMGCYRYNNGTLYIGDLEDKVFQGLGMYIPIEEDSISNCPKASIYVGKFKNGLKNGRGRCYNSAGELIYSGLFKDDKPVGEYPQNGLFDYYFADVVADDFYFLGEYSAEYPNGLGAFFFNSGDIYLTNFVDGVQNGVSVYIKSDGNWISEMQDNGVAIPISSSEEYANLVKNAKANFLSSLNIALGYFAQATQAGVQVADQIKNINAQVGMDGDSVQEFESNGYGGDSSSKMLSDKGNKYNISEQQSYNRDKSTYQKYDGMLSAAFAGNRSASESEIKSWQSKMKNLREKWEKKGRDFPHFPNEDK